ncbi:MAG: hypothetical protein V4717_01515 [Bacteroidota bacterium]
MKIESLIPFQYTGKASTTSYSIEASDLDQAHKIFLNAREKLLHVNEWHALAGAATAVFQLTDDTGKEIDRAVQAGDFFRINIPGPDNAKANGFDWVRVEEVEEQLKHHYHVWVAIKVRPAAPPIEGNEKTAHFFSNEATSSFLVERRGLTIIASVFGRNEKPNNENEGVFDIVRNTIVAVSAMLGFSKPQWKSLVKGILKSSYVRGIHAVNKNEGLSQKAS